MCMPGKTAKNLYWGLLQIQSNSNSSPKGNFQGHLAKADGSTEI